MKKDKMISLIIGSGVLVLGAAGLIAAALLNKSENDKDEEAGEEMLDEPVSVSEPGDLPDEAEEIPGDADPADLEEYMAKNPDERANLDVVKDSFAADGVMADVSFSANTMFFDFMMTDVEDEETKEILKPDLKQFLDDQEEVYRNLVKQISEDTGFDDIKMIVIFMDENGEEIVSAHYDKSGRIM